jgi:hypothetical protein
MSTISDFMEWLRDKKQVNFMVPWHYEKDKKGLKIYRDSDGKIVKGWREPGLDIFADDYEEREAEKAKRGIQCRLIRNTSFEEDADEWCPIRQSVDQLLHEHFNIDPKKLETERRKMLDDLRERNG